LQTTRHFYDTMPDPSYARDSRQYHARDDARPGPSGSQERYAYVHRPAHQETSEGAQIRALTDENSKLTYTNTVMETELHQQRAAYQDLHRRHVEVLARLKGVEDHTRVLEDDLAKALRSKEKHKNIAEKHVREIERLDKENMKLRRASTSPKPNKTSDHLRDRFERRRSTVHQDPYIEPLGPPTPRRRNSISTGGGSGSRRFPTVNVGHHGETQYSTLPRDYREPGNYIPHPVSQNGFF
jgi:hypothetical protein